DRLLWTESISPERIKGQSMYLDFRRLVHQERSSPVLDIHVLGDSSLPEVQGHHGERSTDRRVGTTAEGEDLKLDVALPRLGHQSVELLCHDLGTTDDSTKHRLAEYGPVLGGLVSLQDRLPSESGLYSCLDLLVRRPTRFDGHDRPRVLGRLQ